MYLLYDCLHKSPFSIATQNVLKILDIPFSHITKSFMPHGGYYGRIAKLEHFLFANIYNIALAIQHQGILLALEEDSYANAMFAIHLILHNQNLKDFIHHELQANNISIDLESLSENISEIPKSFFCSHISNHNRMIFSRSFILKHLDNFWLSQIKIRLNILLQALSNNQNTNRRHNGRKTGLCELYWNYL